LAKLIENAEITGRDILDSALSQDKGFILTTIHASWFEHDALRAKKSIPK